MYLWKYWRESRIIFGISMLGIAVLALLVFKGVWYIGNNSGHPDPRGIAQFFIISMYLQVPVFAFLAWVMGSFGVGRDMGEDSGSFLLTRPQRRYWFLWRDWGFGFTQLVVAIVLVNLLIGYLVHGLSGAGGGPFSGTIVFGDVFSPLPLSAAMGLNCLTIVLFAGLIFGVTYFSTIAMKHARGIMLGAGIILGYLILRALMQHYWSVDLPSLLLQAFDLSPRSHNSMGLLDQLGLAVALRGAVVLLIPLAAQVVLERAEI
ncbi:MAG: hypothetical protein WBX22_17515 [Silvibacterium sp.]